MLSKTGSQNTARREFVHGSIPKHKKYKITLIIFFLKGINVCMFFLLICLPFLFTKREQENIAFLHSVIEDSGVGKGTQKKLLDSGRKIAERKTNIVDQKFLSSLTLSSLESIVKRHGELGFSEISEQIVDCMGIAIERLESFELSERALANATAGLGISEKANELKELAKGLGILQAEIARLKGEVTQQDLSRVEIERRIDPEPKMSDYAESGVIEQVAETAMFVFYGYNFNHEEYGQFESKIIVAKSRYGQIGQFIVGFNGNRCKFYVSPLDVENRKEN